MRTPEPGEQRLDGQRVRAGRRTPSRRGGRGARRRRAAGRRCGPGPGRRPGPSSLSRSGSTAWRTRDRVNRGSSLAGSVHQAMSWAPQACSVWARVRSSSGRRNTPNDAAHAGQRPGTAAPGEPEEHGLGLVVEGVAEQHRVRAVAVGDLLQDGVAGLPGGGLEALALGLDPYPDRRGLVGAQRGHLPDDVGGHLGRRLVQAVVDGDAHDRPGTVASLEHGSGQQREGVGTAGARDQDRRGAGVGRRAGGERAAYGDPGGGDGGVGTHDRRPRGPASPRRRDRRSRPWWAGGRGPARRR